MEMDEAFNRSMRHRLSGVLIRLLSRFLLSGYLLAVGFVSFLTITAAMSHDAFAQATPPSSEATAVPNMDKADVEKQNLEKQKLQREILKLEDELSLLNLALRLANALIPLVVVLASLLLG